MADLAVIFAIVINSRVFFGLLASPWQIVIFLDDVFPEDWDYFEFMNDLHWTSHNGGMSEDEVEEFFKEIPSDFEHFSIFFTFSDKIHLFCQRIDLRELNLRIFFTKRLV